MTSEIINTGKCPWCEQRQRLTTAGLIATHAGDPSQVCPGSGAEPDARTRRHDMFRHLHLSADGVTIKVDQRAFSAEYSLDDLPEDELREMIREDFAAWLIDALSASPKWAGMTSARRMGPQGERVAR